MESKKSRILFIDQLKGFAILLVVIGHIYVYVLGSHSALEYKWLSTFHMHLFMFMAGLVAYKPVVCFNLSDCCSFLKKKAVALLLPFIFVGLFYSWLIGDVGSLFTSLMHNGYWFLLVLFEIFIIYCIAQYILVRYNSQNKVYKDLLVYILLYLVIAVPYVFNFVSGTLKACLSWQFFNHYYPYFILGVLIRKYSTFENLLYKNYVYTIVLFIYIFSFSVYIKYSVHYLLYFMPVMAILAFYYLFRRYSSNLVGGKILGFLGTKTLDIYVLHFLFLSPAFYSLKILCRILYFRCSELYCMH
ncbi:acyltransferase family protein [Coprobacter sp.]